MKQFFIYLIAAIIIGSIVFIISYWGFSVEKHIAISLAITGALSALLVEYFKPFFIAKEKRQEEDISKRITRNLGNRSKQI